MSLVTYNRPFLVVTVLYSAKPFVRTNRKAWNDNPNNWRSTELPLVVDKLTKRHIAEASVIIDLTDNTVVKNRFPDVANEDVVKHYTNKYADSIAQAVSLWTEKVIDKVSMDILRNPTIVTDVEDVAVA